MKSATARPRRPKLELGHTLAFMRQLWALDHGLQSASKHMENRLGVTGPQRLAIRILGRCPGMTPGELARTMHIHPSTLTGILKRLEARGLIERRADPADGRRAVLTLSTQGADVDSRRAGTIEAAVRRVLTHLTQSELESTERVLTALSEELQRTD